MPIQFSAFQHIHPKKIFQDFTMLFSKEGRAEIINENHDRHATYTYIILENVILFASMFAAMQIQGFPAWCLIVVSGLVGLVFNGIRESLKQMHGGKDSNGNWIVPFQDRDVRYGLYGGMIAGLKVYILIHFLFN